MRRNKATFPLADLDLVRGSSARELRNAQGLLTLLTIPAGNVVVREDTIGQEFMIVVDGTFSVTRQSGTDIERLATIGGGEVVGEMALLNGAPRSATVTTITPATAYVGNIREFYEFLRTVPIAAERILATARERSAANVAA
jgi:CRP-like cAMP-binding protein